MPNPLRDVVSVGQAAVADADADATERETSDLATLRERHGLGDGDPWIAALDTAAAGVSESEAAGWGAAAVALVAVDHPWYDLAALGGGALHRRIDAVLDYFETDYCAHEVQAHYLEMVRILVEAAEPSDVRALKFMGRMSAHLAGGFAAGYSFSPAPIKLGQMVSDWVENVGRTATNLAFDLAKVLLVWELVEAGADGQRSPAESTLVAHVQAGARAASGEAPDRRSASMWGAVLRLLDAELHEGVEVPDFRGLLLDGAREQARLFGADLAALDVGRVRGDERSVLVDGNWIVVAQLPGPNAPLNEACVFVAVTKQGEGGLEVIPRLWEFTQALRQLAGPY